MSKNTINALDLTTRPPRSPRVRLGGYVLLPRVLDKCRATIAGKNGEYNFDCPLDQHFLNFVGIDGKKLRAKVEKGEGDEAILAWIQKNSKVTREGWEIEQWSNYHNRRGPDSDAETLQFFAAYVEKMTKTREDLRTWFDVLDLDDYVSFGGQA